MPTGSALLPGARHVVLDGVRHSMARIGTWDERPGPGEGYWYGSPQVRGDQGQRGSCMVCAAGRTCLFLRCNAQLHMHRKQHALITQHKPCMQVLDSWLVHIAEFDA